MTQNYIEVKMSLPPEMFIMINEVVRHGVFHMLIPPVDTIKGWIDRDAHGEPKRQHFRSQEEQEAFLHYMDSLIPSSLLGYLDDGKDDGKDEGKDGKDDGTCGNHETKDENDVYEEMERVAKTMETNEDGNLAFLRSAISTFSKHLQDKAVDYLIPMYVKIAETCEDVSSSCLQTNGKIKDHVDDVLFDLLISVKKDLETKEVRAVLSRLNAGDAEYVAWHNILEGMMNRHNYESHAVRDAKDRLHRIFMETLTPVLSSVCNALNDGIAYTMQEMVAEDRRNIPGPQCLE